MISRMPGRNILTTTSRPFSSVATCTCAIEAAASGSASKRPKISPMRQPKRGLDRRDRDRAVERRHPVLELRQLVGDVGRQQVAPGRQRPGRT